MDTIGIEPMTYRLLDDCFTTELSIRIVKTPHGIVRRFWNFSYTYLKGGL